MKDMICDIIWGGVALERQIYRAGLVFDAAKAEEIKNELKILRNSTLGIDDSFPFDEVERAITRCGQVMGGAKPPKIYLKKYQKAYELWKEYDGDQENIVRAVMEDE